MMAAAMEAKEFAEHFPTRVNKVMDALAEGELKLKLEGVDEQALMRKCGRAESSTHVAPLRLKRYGGCRSGRDRLCACGWPPSSERSRATGVFKP